MLHMDACVEAGALSLVVSLLSPPPNRFPRTPMAAPSKSVPSPSPVLSVAQPPSPATVVPSPEDTRSVDVTTGQGLADALANPLKSFARLKSNIQVVEADFPNSIITRSNNFTISGTPGPQTSWPVLDLNFVKRKVGCRLAWHIVWRRGWVSCCASTLTSAF